MRGVSQLILIILLMLIGISLTVSIYLFATGILFETYPSEQYEQEYLRSRACLDLQINNETYVLHLENCGFVPLKKLQLYVDHLPVEADFPVKLEPNEFIELDLGPLKDAHAFKITSDLAESPLITIPFPLLVSIEREEAVEFPCQNPIFCDKDEDCCPGYYCDFNLGITDFGQCAKL